MRYAVGVPNADRLRDAAADAVANKACAFDPQLIEQRDHSFGMCAHVDSALEWTIASTVAEEIDDDDSMPGAHEGNDVVPEMPRSRESVEKHHGIAAAARSGGVVVESRAAEIEKLTAHGGTWIAWGGEDARRPPGKQQGPSLS